MNYTSEASPQDKERKSIIRDYTLLANRRKQYVLTMLFSITCIFFLTIFGFIALSQENILLCSICFVGMGLSTCNLIVLHFTGKYETACHVIVFLMIVLTFYLVCSGGAYNTGPLWFYVMPVLVFYVLELRYGLITLIILELAIAFILLSPDNPLLTTQYDPEFVTRFLASLFSVSLLAFAYEFSRKDWQKEITTLNSLLEDMSRTDELTGLTNRRDMNSRLEEELGRFRQNQHPFSLIIADIDHFKYINDKFGHDCGDVVLKEVARILTKETKQQDIISRWGGEEFLLLLPETPKENGLRVAERLRQAISLISVSYGQYDVCLTMSFGVSEYNGTIGMQECIKIADKNLYVSKDKGRNFVT